MEALPPPVVAGLQAGRAYFCRTNQFAHVPYQDTWAVVVILETEVKKDASRHFRQVKMLWPNGDVVWYTDYTLMNWSFYSEETQQ